MAESADFAQFSNFLLEELHFGQFCKILADSSITYYQGRGIINGKAGKHLPYPNLRLQSFYKVFFLINSHITKVLFGKQSIYKGFAW